MKLVRTVSLIALAVVLGAGYLAGTADAAVLDSVRVVAPTPATAALRAVGIDSLITTEVYFRTSHLDSANVAVWWWLGSASGADTSTVADHSAFAESDMLALAQGLAAPGAPDRHIVAVRAFVAGDVQGDIGIGPDPSKTAADVVDTVYISRGPAVPAGFSWKMTIVYTLDAGVGELPNITPFASIQDKHVNPATTDPSQFTAPKRAARAFAVDGQRPIPDAFFAISPIGSTGQVTVLGFGNTGAWNREVVGIGDTVDVNYNLGWSSDDIVLLNTLRLSAELYGKPFNLGFVTQQVGTGRILIPEGVYGNISRADTTYGWIEVFLTDLAGNRSHPTDPSAPIPQGVTQAANFLIDGTRPTMDTAAGDTLLPVDGATISDGGVRDADVFAAWMPFPDDNNPMVYNVAEALYKLNINFDSASGGADQSYTITNAEAVRSVAAGLALSPGENRRVDLPNVQAGVVAADSELYVYPGTGASAPEILDRLAAITDTSLATGTYNITFQPVDAADNTGLSLTRSNVYVDVTDISLARLFPSKAAFGEASEARVDTIEEATAQVQFQLSEPADSVRIVYHGIEGTDAGNSRVRALSGSQLTSTGLQTFAIDSLKSGTKYQLAIMARDLAGNYTISGPDTFYYDTSYVVPTIKQFVIAAAHKGYGDPLTAGTGDLLTITAKDSARVAVLYHGTAILTATGGQSITYTGTGVTDLGGGVASLDAATWLAGKRTVTVNTTVAPQAFTMSIVDNTTAGGPYTGALDSAIVYVPGPYAKIVVTAPDTVEVGAPFGFTVRLADQYGNKVGLTKYVQASKNKLGVDLPDGELYIAGGETRFQAMASMVIDSLVIRVRDMQTDGGFAIDGVSGPISVVAAGTVAGLDAPDTLLAEDYMGADGQGDQGGFVLLTWALSADHATIDGYRIYRQIQVTTGLDDQGNVITLSEPITAWMPWAFVDAVPGETIGRAIVATLDNVPTLWAIAAERGGQTTAKEAFDGAADITAAYQLMSGTMAASKAAQTGITFATLTPEALSFIEKGVAPRMKTTGSVVQSQMVETAGVVRAIDNIAPAPVTAVRAVDTPSDGGSSITISWSKSVSDEQIASSVPAAVGLGTTYFVDGVAGYNVYRKIGQNTYTLVGQAGPGSTSFADVTALNGIRYTYKVSPFDQDNVTESTVERSAMAFRNNAVDAQGVPIHALYGTDNQVGFDDFFLFADNFGMTSSWEYFEPAFDLVSSGRIDFEDFFAFADDFGRVAVGVGKVVPALAGLNTDARLYMAAGAVLPKVGDEVALQLSLADFSELKGYGFSLSYDANKLEFVKVVREGDALGGGELASPQILSQKAGEVSVGAFGEAVSEGEVGLSVVFRTKTEIEESLVEVTESLVRDGSYAINQVALPAPVQIQTRPDAFALRDNYPNPFNPATTIKYALPEGAFVKLEIYNVVGQVVRTLVSSHQTAGRYVVQWDATNDSGHSLSSGIYFYRLRAGNEFAEVKKMLLLK